MKLKEQFDNVEIMFENQIGTLKYDELKDATNQCLLIAEKFAIEFAMSISNHCYCELGNDTRTYQELLDIFKKEKNL